MYGYEGLKVVREPAGVDVHRCYRRLVMAVAAQWVKDARGYGARCAASAVARTLQQRLLCLQQRLLSSGSIATFLA